MKKHKTGESGPTPAAVVNFWREAGPQRWFAKDLNFDRALGARFHEAHLMAAQRRLDAWNAEAEGALALQILLDQVPRNLYRGSAHAFATDPLARHFALAALDAGLDQLIEPTLRPFCYMALMHAEDLQLQERCVALFEALGGPSLPHAIEHRDIIRRFGRFPHRNPLFGRPSSAEEQAFLDAAASPAELHSGRGQQADVLQRQHASTFAVAEAAREQRIQRLRALL